MGRVQVPLKKFLAGIQELSHNERARIVEQAIMLLEGFHVNLPLKCAMYAVDPLRRLRMLQRQLRTLFRNDRHFHREMTEIFNSINDLHTNYLLPEPYACATASLPFRVERYYDGDHPTYLATQVETKSVKSATFRDGVEILDWNGVPISRAVEMAGAQSPSGAGNLAARHALGAFSLTTRGLNVLPPPDEEWVIVGYRTRSGGKRREIRIPWWVSYDKKPDKVPYHGSMVIRGIQKHRKSVVAPTQERSFCTQEIATPHHGKVGYLRIFAFDHTFDVDDLIAGIKRLPRHGLIIDLRGNGGGVVATAERLLQVISPNYPQYEIEPQRVCFINHPRTLELCKLQKTNPRNGPLGLSPWIDSIRRALITGATYSASFPYTDPKLCNVTEQWRYPGPVIVVTDGLTRSAAEILAAGFQDHGGKILGVDAVTAGAGANVRNHSELRQYFKDAPDSPFKLLPKNADFAIPFRRFQRVGLNAGNEIEDFGVRCNYRHRMTRNDVLNDNVDLIKYAASILVSKDVGARKARHDGSKRRQRPVRAIKR